MKITPTEAFLEGDTRYEPGIEYDVDDELGYRVTGAGWATSPGVPPPWSGAAAVMTPVDLLPDDIVHDHDTDEGAKQDRPPRDTSSTPNRGA